MDDVGEENSRSFLGLIAGTARAMGGHAIAFHGSG
jgi:hypothetical protein